ncbi:MAG: AAA family ATPase [Candidatus Eisenbacteria bacterium]
MRKKVIGAVGKNGSGKDTALDIIADEYGVPSISMGDIVRDIAREKGIEPTRANLNEISRSHFEKYGNDYFIRIVIDRLDAAGAPFTVVTGIRTYLDARTLRDRYGDRFLLINVIVSDDEERLRRARTRGSARDPKTIDELLEHDAREERIFGIQKAATLSTTTMVNDGSLEDLKSQVDAWVSATLPELCRKTE